jgi:hypothetical protein
MDCSREEATKRIERYLEDLHTICWATFDLSGNPANADGRNEAVQWTLKLLEGLELIPSPEDDVLISPKV